MTPPLILCENGDINLFEFVEDLERYVESPDIAAYRVFDANGDVLHLTTEEPVSEKKRWLNIVQVVPVRIDVDAPRANAAGELEGILRAFLIRATGKPYGQSALPELLAALQATIGFTR